MERSILQGLPAFRWGAWLWMVTVLLASREDLERPCLAIGLAGLALGITVTTPRPFASTPAPSCNSPVGAPSPERYAAGAGWHTVTAGFVGAISVAIGG